MAFFEVEQPEQQDYIQHKTTKYQSTTDLEELKRNWSPDDMLPKMWKDLQ